MLNLTPGAVSSPLAGGPAGFGGKTVRGAGASLRWVGRAAGPRANHEAVEPAATLIRWGSQFAVTLISLLRY